MQSQTTTRRQATLFLRAHLLVDGLRREFNAEQARLIASHVTLCREDEVSDWEQLAQRLESLRPQQVTLDFGMPCREDNLVYLPCVGSTYEFDHLRAILLNTSSSIARPHKPHITIIHARNGTCDNSIFERVSSQCRPFSATFHEVSFIEQTNGGIWTVLNQFPLSDRSRERVS